MSYTAKPEPLTKAQLAVVRLAAEGFSNKRIGAALGISPHTVKFHLCGAMRALRTEDRTHTVVQAIRAGYMEV